MPSGSGSTTYFVDTANGKIYSKTFNAYNGTAPLEIYSREVEAPAPAVQYVTTEQFEALCAEVEKLRTRGKVKKTNDESDE